MFWTVLIIILLCAICGVFWLHRKQERDWQHELARLERGMQEGTYIPHDQDADSPHQFSEDAKAAYGKTIARLRLMAARYTPQQEQSTEEQVNAENEETEAGMPDIADFFESQEAKQEYHQDTDAERSSENAQTEPVHQSETRQHHASLRKDAPYIVPFVETEEPEYIPRIVKDEGFEEITLEEATRSLNEAALQEWEEQQTANHPAEDWNDDEEAIQLIRASVTPMKGLQIIDFNDPVLRRTRERVMAGVNGIQIPKASAPHIETVQTALRTAEREAILPVIDNLDSRAEIDVTDIRNTLARSTAARQRLAAAVAPVRDFQPQIIQNDEILANLIPASRRRTVRHAEAAAEKLARKQQSAAAQMKLSEEANPQPEQTVAPSVARKPLFPPKTIRTEPVAPPKEKAVYISRQPAPTATVVEPPEVPTVIPAPIDIPAPPSFTPPPVAPEIVEPQMTRSALEIPAFHSEVNAHVSDNPVRSIHDYLISESETEDEIAGKDVQQNAETESTHTENAEISAFEHHQPIHRPDFATGYAADDFDEDSEEDTGAFYEFSDDLKQPLPTTDLLLPPQFDPAATQTEEELLNNSITIEEKLAEFKVKVKVVDSYSGPVITRYEIEPDVGVRGNSVMNLEKDLARSLGVASIRVVETIPGKTCMGLELPNPKRQMIRLSEIFNSPAFAESKSKLTLALGQDITGQPVVTDLGKAPHLLVAGTTGSGKSVGVNAMILSMLFKATPEDVRMIMIDPKMLELSIYEGIPHLLAPVVTDMKLAANALNWCVNEMEKRYRLMSHVGVRNLAGFNQKIMEVAAQGIKIANPFSLTPDNPEPLEKLPFIVVVVDEFADLMMTAGKKIEELIARLAQKARAAGIHLILATQRPSVDVITGLIKANIPTRIAFQVSSKIDSRTILDQMGAENLLGQGDMLFLPPGTGYPQRVHGAFASDDEVHRVVEYLKQFGEPDYIDDILMSGTTDDLPGISRSSDGEVDPMYDEAVSVVLKTRKASISGIQRQLRIGYNRAARLIDQMEADGIVSPAETNGNRTVLAQSNEHLD
ncbi:DNA translocase FtsK [Neisseria sicca]|jgi:putative cell division protein ftsK|uniref:DNA translocase FtsK n=1 Tax=Neisseria sicca TaxID=490 RepID=UPI000D2F83A6|nr:DNA translocase FtsK [Neisseria sicca]